MRTRKTPKRTLQARTSVTSRVSPMDSPDWKPASGFAFKTPKSPSPVKRTTRRSSVYKAAATVKTSSKASTFKMPGQRVTSPPGVKTRARRSSVYHKGGAQLSSPPSSRTRRRSMYVSRKAGLPALAEFSKVWATPVKQVEPVVVKSPEMINQSPLKSRTRKTPKVEKPAAPQTKKTPARSDATNTSKTPAKSNAKTPAKSNAKTPAKSNAKTPAKTVSKSSEKSPELVKKTPVKKEAAAKMEPTPKAKTPRSAVKSSTKKQKRACGPVSSSTPQTVPVDTVVTSTPSKTLKAISGKSFYSTPSETPIPLQRSDDVFVFSAQPAKSAKKISVKRATILSPKITPHKRNMKTPKKTPLRKTPAAKKRSRDDFATSTPSAKRAKTSPDVKTQRSTKRSAQKSLSKSPASPTKAVLTPTEMSSILMDVVETEMLEERRASLSPSPRPRKLAKLASQASMSTPRVSKVAKRASPKKLAKMHDRNQSSSTGSDKPWTSIVSDNTSLLEETINTDSRSGRCIIL